MDMESSSEKEDKGNNSDMPISCLQIEKWCINEDLYKFHGVWLPKAYVETTTTLLQDLNPHPKDVILASFPKTGTTWLKALLYSIMNRSTTDLSSLASVHPHHLVPSLETYLYIQDKKIGKKDSEEGRILATHLPHPLLKDILDSSNSKIVYVTRNPKDTFVSLWHFVQTSQHFKQDPWELEFAVDQFCKGIVPFGPYYDHVLEYRKQSIERPANVLLVTYEGLKKNPNEEVARMAQFLGCPFEKEGGGDDDEIDRIVEMCSFGRLSNFEVNKRGDVLEEFPLPYNSFFRRGEVGDYRNCLVDEMAEKIDGVTWERFYGIGFQFGI